MHPHAVATDGAFEEDGGAQRFLLAPTPTAERAATLLAQVHEVLATVDRDDPHAGQGAAPRAAPSGRGA